jgi:hypothetical protein
MIIIKYAIYYTFIGVYQTMVALGKMGVLVAQQFSKLNSVKNKGGQGTSVRSTLLRTAFRSIL